MITALEELTSLEVKDRLKQGLDTAVLPIGAVEQHGPHCPLGTDALKSGAVSAGVAEKIKAVCLPRQWFGVSPHHMDFPGTVTLKPEVLIALVENILESLIHHGFKKILIINGHGGNIPSIDVARMNVKRRYSNIFTAVSNAWVALQDVYDQLPAEVRQENWRTMISHGGLFETSMVMAIKEGVVKLDKAQTVSVDRYVLATDPAMSVSVTMGEVTDGKGSNGDPSSANSAIGEMFLEKTIDIIADKFFAAVNKFAVGNP